MTSYKALNRKHPDYDVRQFKELKDLYTGGFSILKNARHYLPKLLGEPQQRYKQRIEQASYIPYFGEIIDFFVSNLFNQDLTVTPPSDAENPETPGTFPNERYYSAFYRNADRSGNPFADVVKEAFRDSIIYKRAVVCVDFPSDQNDATTLLEEEELGLADAYVYHISTDELINWQYDEYGNLEWCVTKCTYLDTPDPLSDKVVWEDEFKVWRLNDDGYAYWEKYEIEYEEEQRPKEDAELEVSLAGKGVTNFRSIPVVVLEIPEGLWVGNKIGPLAIEHFRRRSLALAAEQDSLVAIPVAALGPEIGAFQGSLPSDAQTNPHRGDDPVAQFRAQGYLVTGSEDKLYFLEPTGTAYQIVDRELSELRDEMFRVVHQMAQGVTTSSGGALRRSGLSKIKDAEATVIILGEYGRLVRRFAEKIYKTISTARNEDVSWIARGLDTFEVDQRQQVIDEATKIDLINIPSRTFKTEYKTQLAFQILPNVHSNIQQTIRDEIRQGVEENENLLDDMVDKGVLMPGLPGVPMPTPPGGKDSGKSGASNAEAISRGQAGVGGKIKPKQMVPQPRQFGGRFGPKPG